MQQQLLEAIHASNHELVRRLIGSGVLPSRQRRLLADTESPLVLAARIRSLPMVHLLLDLGAPADEIGESGYTALQVACKDGSLAIAQTLLQYGASVSAHRHRPTAIALAAFSGKTALVKLMIEHGGNPADVWVGGVTSALRLRAGVLRELVAASDSVPEGVARLLEIADDV